MFGCRACAAERARIVRETDAIAADGGIRDGKIGLHDLRPGSKGGVAAGSVVGARLAGLLIGSGDDHEAHMHRGPDTGAILHRIRDTESVAAVPRTIFPCARNYCGAGLSPGRLVPRVASCSNSSAGFPGEAFATGGRAAG